MTELIKVDVNENQEQVLSARELHERLGIAQRFTDWFKYQSERLCLKDGQDFITILGESTGGRPSIDYIVTIDIAKHLCMMSGGEKAHQIRDYFIQVEKAWNSPDQVMARALQIAQKQIASYKNQVALLKPKAEFFDQVASSRDAIDIGTAAKVLHLGIGRNKLFEILRQEGVLMNNNQPYQKYIDCGYFRTIEQKYNKPDGSVNINIKTLVYQKGLNYIKKLVEEKCLVRG
jgi:anti-repressor protein